MFQIKSYLQYKNTPDGKPRVLVEGVDYFHKGGDKLWQFKGYSNTPDYEGHLLELVADLDNCRPLLTVESYGQIITEGDIIERLHCKDIVFFDSKHMPSPVFHYPDNDWADFECDIKKNTSFFDAPDICSKALWGISEAEGWKKVFDILGI